MANITMTPVNSSNILEVGHDSDTNTLIIKFRSGWAYEYYSVPKQIYSDLLAINQLEYSSVNGYFEASIKGIYKYRRIQ